MTVFITAQVFLATVVLTMEFFNVTLRNYADVEVWIGSLATFQDYNIVAHRYV